MRTFKIIAAVSALLFTSCKLSNIYTDSHLNPSEKRVDTLLAKTINAYGGQQNWENTKTVSIVLQDEWPTFHWRLLANPWANRTTLLKFDWQPNQNNSRITILSRRKKGKTHGIQNWATYKVKDSMVVFKQQKKFKFHLPTMEYLLEFPFRINEATMLKYGGTAQVNGIDYDIVLMSWTTFEPQKEYDQYIIYINPKTHFIDYLEFTVREQGKFTFATVSFQDFKRVQAFIFPHKVTAYFQNRVPGKTIGHQMTVDTLFLNKQFPASYFIPDDTIVLEK